MVNFPFRVAFLEAFGLELIRKASFNLIPSIITIDQVRQLHYDNIVGEKSLGMESFGIKATSLEVVLPQYLWRYRKGGKFS